jgi:hypothetical protein
MAVSRGFAPNAIHTADLGNSGKSRFVSQERSGTRRMSVAPGGGNTEAVYRHDKGGRVSSRLPRSRAGRAGIVWSYMGITFFVQDDDEESREWQSRRPRAYA